MEYELPSKSLLEKSNDEIKVDKRYYSLSKLVYHKDFKDKLVFPIGIDNNKDKYYIDFNLKSGMLISGQTGSGKSMFLNTILISLLLKNTPEELQFVFIDPRNVEFKAYEGIPHLLKKVSSDKNESICILRNLMLIMEQRRELFIKNKLSNIESYNSTTDKKMPQIILIIDEIFDILESDKVKKTINKILSEGYKFGIHLILATNSYFKTYFDEETINMFNYVLTFDLASEEQANFIKIKSANLLSTYGEALVKKQEKDILDVQAPYTSDNDIDAITNFWKEQKNTNN